MARGTIGRHVAVLLPANLIGALVSFTYFTFVDFRTPPLPGGHWRTSLAFFVVGFGVLMVIVLGWVRRWTRALEPGGGAAPLTAETRRRALLFPYALAGITFCGWALASLIFGWIRPAWLGTFTLERALRFTFGNTFVAGTATTAFTFFVTEHLWRKDIGRYFPEGDLSAVPRVFRLRVRTRLLVMFLLVGVVPLSVLGVMAYQRAASLPGMEPEAATQVVGSLLVSIAFIALVGVIVSIALAVFVAASVATPLGEVQRAMRRVERGALDTRCPVVTNDEIGAAAEGFNRMVSGLKEREMLRETFGKYVSPEIRDEILSGRVSLQGQAQDVTILFSDLRDFTPWVERTTPQDVVRDLNTYFTEMEGAIREHHGLVVQFIGDGIEAVFGAPVGRADHPTMAVRAALEMRRRLAVWNVDRERAGKPPLRHGIGIHTGRVLAGNIGSSERLAYALIGDPVNLASRIQGLNKELGSDVLLSAATYQRLGDHFDTSALPAVLVKGKSVEVEVYRLE